MGWLGGALPAAGGPATIQARYAPLHPPNNQPVTFQFKAKATEGISRIRLYLYEYEWVDQTEVKKREGGAWGLVKTWTHDSPPPSASGSFTRAAGFPAQSFVLCLVQVKSASGVITEDRHGFAAGDWISNTLPIPLWVPVPASGVDAGDLLATSGSSSPARLHLMFAAQKDDPQYLQPRDMLGHVAAMIFDHVLPHPSIGPEQRWWGFHYSPERAHIPPATASEGMSTTPTQELVAAQDHHVVVILHTEEFQDWRLGNFMGTEPGAGNFGTTVHELGHALFNLADEYPASTPPLLSDTVYHNVYATANDCIDYLFQHRHEGVGDYLDESYCQLLMSSPQRYRVEPLALNCVMRVGKVGPHPGNLPQYAPSCVGRVRWFYDQLE